jgi:hypothetical protein
VIVIACGGNPDGPVSFLSHDSDEAIFVQWTRTGDDVSGTLSAAEVTQPQAASQTGFFSTALPAGQIAQQIGPFTGTVRNDSVRLLIGSGSSSNRINGRLDGDTLEFTIPEDAGVATIRLKPASRGDYPKAVQQIRENAQQRKAAAKAALARKQRADKIAIKRVAIAFQKALNPASQDDPCRYVTSDVRERVLGVDSDPANSTCRAALREDDAGQNKPFFKAPLGVTAIKFGPLPPLGISLEGGPSGAVVFWRPKPPAGSLEQGRMTMFIGQSGRWLVYRCCP